MTEKEENITELRKIMRRVLFEPDRPSKTKPRLKIIRTIQEKLRSLSYEQLEEINCDLNLLDDDES